MGKWYEGNAPCPGCGKTGAEVARKSKDSLCDNCLNELAIGRQICAERHLERNNYLMDDLQIGVMTWYTVRIREIDNALSTLLHSFSRFDRRYAPFNGPYEKAVLTGELSTAISRDFFVLPSVTFEAAKKLCDEIRKLCNELNQDRDNYKKELEDQLRDMKNAIFNDGVQYGRDLLHQLNSGDITADELNKFIKKF